MDIKQKPDDTSKMLPKSKIIDVRKYDYEKNLNWRDDGDILMDPSMNDYLKGYNIDPYEFKQWASKNKIELHKTAAREQIVLQFLPEYLANNILTRWNGADGPLQNFFEGYTLRYDNKLKNDIAKCLEDQGYKVYPVLTDNKTIYAKNNNIIMSMVKSKNVDNIINYSKSAFNSEGLRLFVGEVDDLKEQGYDITNIEAAGLINYYTQIYPEDFALQLVQVMFDGDQKVMEDKLESFCDFNISEESLDAIENYMSGNADPVYFNDGGAGDFGYDFISDMRSDSTIPGGYEIRISKKKI